MANIALDTPDKTRNLKPAKLAGKVQVILSHGSVQTVLDQWHAVRPELDLGPLGLFAALAHAYWLTAPEIERLMAGYSLTRGMFDVLTTLRRVGPPWSFAALSEEPQSWARSLATVRHPTNSTGC